VGFALTVVVTLAVGVVSVVALRDVVSSKDHVINVTSRLLIDAQALNSALGSKSSAARAYLLTGEQQHLTQMNAARREFNAVLDSQKQLVDGVDAQQLATIAQDENAHQQALDAVIAQRRKGGATDAALGAAFTDTVDPAFATLSTDISSFVDRQETLRADGLEASSDTASKATVLIGVIAGLGVLIAAGLAIFLTRSLRRRIGSAVGDVKSSSTELQASANQQATGAKEQATAMNEITTTISELLATSRQISESAQRVAEIAEQTAGAGRSGVQTIAKANESIADIRRQVDVIVEHMLELGEKSQQIGAVLDIVTELAEQTNILAINSTIEAAGAGEAGKRFSVVADEIRKLADRVADSTKEIRGLIDVVRSAVNTTVMATEIGSKAVDAGGEQFADVANAFSEIDSLVATTTEAAREIELSTKQQTTAVEQVNAAIADVAQSTREAESSSTQTLQTASQLTLLSGDLARLVQTQAAA
jgi:methyl-accepting chemotaxis protein